MSEGFGHSRHRSAACFVLEEVLCARGPLFADPVAAAARALALGEVFVLTRAGRNRSASLLAARTLGVHNRGLKPAKFRASREGWARARALLTDLQRAGRKLRHDPLALQEEFARLLLCGRVPRDFEEWAYMLGYAAVLAALFDTEDERLRLIAARSLLSWTRQAARKVGRARVPAPQPPGELSGNAGLRGRPGRRSTALEAAIPRPAPPQSACAGLRQTAPPAAGEQGSERAPP